MGNSRNFYDAEKYDVLERQWFALPATYGGDGLSGVDFGTHNPGTLTHVAKWFPAGAIEIKKIGVLTASVSHNASGGGLGFRFLTRGASASVIGTMKWASSTQAAGLISASKAGSNLTVRQCKAGEYITIQTTEPTTFSGTASEVKGTTSGRAAFFVDYVRKYVESDANWDNE